jgi:hypothetical protein
LTKKKNKNHFTKKPHPAPCVPFPKWKGQLFIEKYKQTLIKIVVVKKSPSEKLGEKMNLYTIKEAFND